MVRSIQGLKFCGGQVVGDGGHGDLGVGEYAENMSKARAVNDAYAMMLDGWHKT
ncbi:MAG: hypothetical protein ABJP79_04910 [Tateyamaria sp.]|uniref:hypothetical protein n=1 Tax=Tateyamaria sp. TaxID=1929288 RepID=UPI00329E4C27